MGRRHIATSRSYSDTGSDMKKIITGFLILTGIFFFLLIIISFQKDEEIRNYKKLILGSKYDYLKLKSDFENYKDQIKNQRQITVLNNNSKSTNVKIADIIDKYSKKTDGNLSIYYKNLTTGEYVIIDENRKYYMASLYKVILTLYILEQIKQNKLSLDTKVGSESAITTKDALNKIVTESNNEYAQSFAEKYGWLNIEKHMKKKLGIEFGFNTKLEVDIKNIGLLFEEIALSLKMSDTENDYLLKLLGDQQKISKLPKYLPKNIYSHNKTGEFENYSHDAGIFYTPKTNYILIFMSKTETPYTTDEQMAQMSKEIYEELNK